MKTLETYNLMRKYLGVIRDRPEVNAIDHGFNLTKGEITLGVAVNMTRAKIKRVLTEDCDPEEVAQEIVGEMLIKINEILNAKEVS